MFGGPVVNNSTRRVQRDPALVNQFGKREAERCFEPGDAERAALELLHFLAAGDAARDRSRWRPPRR